MTTGAIIRLVLQALVFIAWAFMMYSVLFKFRRRNEDQTGGAFPSTGGFMAQAKYWLKSEEDRQERKTLFFLTFVLIAMNVMNILNVYG
ncbi:hypothetical protein [Gymnodinialimonas hymeniacidonis]|uniref:hypothetical protein n=1 Tax=Gymnodinialimonas hymeniacidonis TaxID=3126508 RepID=UPI0034C6237C